MSETVLRNPNIKTKTPNKSFVYGAAILAALGIGAGVKKFGVGNSDPFATNLSVPTESQPHIDYRVMPGDSESSIAAHFGHADDMNFENMLNAQLPKEDQHERTLRPDEVLRVPEQP